MKKSVLLVLVLILLVIVVSTQDHFCSPSPGPMDDSQSLKLLQLKRTQLELAKSRGEHQRALALKKEGLISEQDYVTKETAYLQAQVSYQEALIRFLGSEGRIAVLSAVKAQESSGRKSVVVTLSYSSRELMELKKLNIEAQEVFPLDYLKEVKDVYVSLKSSGEIISEPYQIKIPVLPLEKPARVSFLLLKDVEKLEVSVSSAAQNEVTALYLQKGVSVNMVTVNSAQFSQEADLEGEATYDLSLEKFSGEGNVFKLETLNLPPQISAEFVDPKTQARLFQIKFTEGVTSMNLSLRLYLPKSSDDQVKIDRPLEFSVLVLDQTQAAKVEEMKGRGRRLSPEDLSSLKAGVVNLELIPRGVGKLEIEAANLYHEIKKGEEVSFKFKTRNGGTRRLNNLRFWFDLPLNWQARIEPESIASLDPGQETLLSVHLVPPSDVTMGDYEPKLKSEGDSDKRHLEGEEKIVRVHISERVSLWGVGFLVLLLGGVLTGIVVFGLRLTRR